MEPSGGDNSAASSADAAEAVNAGRAFQYAEDTESIDQKSKALYAPHFPSRKKFQLNEAGAATTRDSDSVEKSNAVLPGTERTEEAVGSKPDIWLDPAIVQKYLDRGPHSVKSNRSRFVIALQGALQVFFSSLCVSIVQAGEGPRTASSSSP